MNLRIKASKLCWISKFEYRSVKRPIFSYIDGFYVQFMGNNKAFNSRYSMKSTNEFILIFLCFLLTFSNVLRIKKETSTTGPLSQNKMMEIDAKKNAK